MKVKESLYVTFDEISLPPKTSTLEDDDLVEEEAIKDSEKKTIGIDVKKETLEIDEIVNIKESKSHLLENVIGNLNQRAFRSQAQEKSNFSYFLLTIEPKNVSEALEDERWVVAMQEELNQLIANDVWELVPNPKSMTVIGTKWVFRNKLDENGFVSRNKDRLVAQGYNQQEGIYYDETYAPVYMAQPLGFIDFKKPNHVYKLKKAMYNLKQAPKAWSDIMFSVCLCERFQEDPKTSHLEAVKHIFLYIKGIMHLGLWYPQGSDMETVVYADFDHVRDYVD
nr:hypothetical protein [Tanacetum cinerariifolium]